MRWTGLEWTVHQEKKYKEQTSFFCYFCISRVPAKSCIINSAFVGIAGEDIK